MCHVLCFIRIIFDNPHKSLKSQHCHSSHFTEKETEALRDTESDLGRLTPGFTYIPLFFTFLTYKSWGRLVICEQDGLGQCPRFYQESFLQWSNQGLKSLMVDSSQFLLWPHWWCSVSCFQKQPHLRLEFVLVLSPFLWTTIHFWVR